MLSIRTQDKKQILVYTGVEVVDGYMYMKGKSYLLGKYESEERALEVIDDIVDAICFISVYEMPEE